MEKGSAYLSRRPIPLMFIAGPPIRLRVPIVDDESTSVFVKEESSSNSKELAIEVPKINPTIQRKLNKVQTPFGRRVYQPLTFKLNEGEEVFGIIDKIEENVVMIHVNGDEDTIMAVASHDIVDIIWRGKSLPEK